MIKQTRLFRPQNRAIMPAPVLTKHNRSQKLIRVKFFWQYVTKTQLALITF